uniref:DDE Tnp4 domain-containing protein n=1 Tax=Glossina brevipalpis TaxID=37001 RepID=A0A1A9WWQ5_9MUSC
MSLTVVKYRKVANGETTLKPAILIKSKLQTQSTTANSQNDQGKTLQPTTHVKKPIIKLQGNSGLVINKIPAIIKPATMKRSNAVTIEPPIKSTKYSLQTIASAGTPLTSFQWQQTAGSGNNTNFSNPLKKGQLGAAISSLPPNTIIKPANTALTSATNSFGNSVSNNQTSVNATTLLRRPTIYIKRDIPKRTVRTVTLELIEKNPYIHLGVHTNRLPILKNVVCPTANVSLVNCYLTLKKLRQNEDFSLLAEYFEMSEVDVQQIFARSVVKLAKYLRFLIRWSDSKKYYDRHKTLPFAYRQNLSYVQSLIECVETEMSPLSLQMDCNVYKYILSINMNGIISFISEAYVGHHDDLTIFKASNFKNVIPKYLSLVADPGKAIRRKRKPKTSRSKILAKISGETDSTTDSADESADDLVPSDENDDGRVITKYTASRVAGELASQKSLNIVNNELITKRLRNFSIPTMHVREPICRMQIRHMVNCLREFKVLQPLGIQDAILYQYLNEILIVCGALTNLQK